MGASLSSDNINISCIGTPPLLVPGHQTHGLLESIGPGLDDLIHVRVAGEDLLVGAEILPKIEGHVGDQITIWNIEGQFHAGVLSPCPQ